MRSATIIDEKESIDGIRSCNKNTLVNLNTGKHQSVYPSITLSLVELDCDNPNFVFCSC